MCRIITLIVTYLLFFIVIITSNPVNATPLFSQLPGSDIGPTSQGAQIAAENFLLSDTAVVTDLHWWGYYGNTNPTPDDFTISFYNDNGSGKPNDTSFAEITASEMIAYAKTDSGLTTPAGTTIYKYDTFFSTPVSIAGGNRYYISIYNDIERATWGWVRSPATSNLDGYFWNNYPLPIDSWRIVTSGALAFELTADPIPEPTTMILFGLGLMVFAGVGRKKIM